MRPEQRSLHLLGVTRSKAKMLEYSVPREHHIKITQDPAKLFRISIALLGDLAAAINLEEPDQDLLTELKSNLLFSARFFDSYLQTKLNESLDPYLLLLGSSSYYLCDLPGSASVLAKCIKGNCPDLDGEGLEALLLWMLQANINTYFEGSTGPYGKLIDEISRQLSRYIAEGDGEELLVDLARQLRNSVYDFGTPRQLLFGDVIGAVLRKKLDNSSWKALPLYSGLNRVKWLSALQKETFIKEFWPAQHLLGRAGVLKGESAIVQMPTSAGKTKATELVLRSAFLAERVSLAIIIAPFRALCHEIKNSLAEAFLNETVRVDELSDTPQADFEATEFLGHQQILVVTPEKLLYVLRHDPELASQVGLVVFDEGHQFDDGSRGISYELLLTSLRFMLPEITQKVLISAVISNAEAIGEWLNGSPEVVQGTALSPTFRSVGFVSWMDQLGRIEYVNSQNAEEREFFVPRVIEKLNLGRIDRERTDRFFPNENDEQSIALYLGLKLVPNGSIAIFCGRKSTATKICEKAINVIKRGAPLTFPTEFSDMQEVDHLSNLYVQNLGADAAVSQSAVHGIFTHHGNTPHGIRLAVEHAMRKNLVRFVICTSTLAQGVNLPIRYLIVTSVYQGTERIKVRDFHNLIGRAGRAGLHTEGSILFSDPVVYDKKKVRRDRWRWEQVKELLEPQNSEPCISNLLSFFDLIKSSNGKIRIILDDLDVAVAHIGGPDDVARLIERLADTGFPREELQRQIRWRIELINAIESFLLSHWHENEGSLLEEDVIGLAEGTLAFFLANAYYKKERIRELFLLLAKNIYTKIPDSNHRQIYGRTLYGVQDAQAIEGWVRANETNLFSLVEDIEVLDLVWPMITEYVGGGVFSRFDPPEVLKEITYGWICGESFSNLLKLIKTKKTKMIWGNQRREFKVDHVVEVCEGKIAYDGALLIGAICEIVELLDQNDTEKLVQLLQRFQKQLKYGLPSETTITVYELGFSDRVISQDLMASLNLTGADKKGIVKQLKQERDRAIAVIEKYPSYFQERMSEILQS
ncbi:DEAD/DEAH box helicase [Endozoicomonas sp. ALD040]|uniref:DEAD/DEAH box helicase n=1 Tax=Endozoicomonas sp. ALD040 TaxID=3403079 RepID=UPI003BB0DA10